MYMKKLNYHRRHLLSKGFSLFEVTAAIACIGLAFASLFLMQTSIVRRATETTQFFKTFFLAQYRLGFEELQLKQNQEENLVDSYTAEGFTTQYKHTRVPEGSALHRFTDLYKE